MTEPLAEPIGSHVWEPLAEPSRSATAAAPFTLPTRDAAPGCVGVGP